MADQILRPTSQELRGFTLTELLIVAALLGFVLILIASFSSTSNQQTVSSGITVKALSEENTFFQSISKDLHNATILPTIDPATLTLTINSHRFDNATGTMRARTITYTKSADVCAGNTACFRVTRTIVEVDENGVNYNLGSLVFPGITQLTWCIDGTPKVPAAACPVRTYPPASAKRLLAEVTFPHASTGNGSLFLAINFENLLFCGAAPYTIKLSNPLLTEEL